MEGFGHDVAQKIKSAIRAKLVELDAYVDDELPDYIMVMVANKKPKASMTEDLSLFLNEHTEHFTDWLHEVLNKLHSVSLGSRAGGQSVGSSSETKKSHSSDGAVESPAEHETVTTTTSQICLDDAQSVAVKIEDAAVVDTSLVDVDPQDDFLAIKAEQEKDDILGKELQEELAIPAHLSPSAPIVTDAPQPKPLAKIQALKSELIVKKSTTPKHQVRVQQPTLPEIVPTVGPRLIRTRLIDPDKPEVSLISTKSKTNGTPVGNAASKPTAVISNTESTLMSRKRKAPTSALGAVVKRSFPQSDDEEDDYDPRHPVIGTVASVVQVTKRKSSIPPERQANKALLFKAMDEARQSILRSTKLRRDINVDSDSVKQLYTRNYLSTIEQQNEVITSKSLLKMPQGSSSPLLSPTIGPITRQSKILKKSPVMKPTSNSIVATNETSETPIIVYEPMIIERQQDTGAMETLDMKMENLEQEDSEELALDYSSEELMECPTLEPVRLASPKFIITLDGVDADNMFPDYADVLMDPSDETHKIVVDNELDADLQEQPRIKRLRQTATNLSRQRLDDEMEYDDDEETENLEGRGATLTQERCRYWPSCRNGDDCTFRHPSILCKLFPNCNFGTRCLYIHPPCKFESSCGRHDCPYTHSLISAQTIICNPPPVTQVVNQWRRPFAKVAFGGHERVSLSTSTSKLAKHKTRCRDFPKCSNMDCPFLHPKPCRYGVGCSRPNCIFSHPSLPDRNRMSWKNHLLSGDQSKNQSRQQESGVINV